MKTLTLEYNPTAGGTGVTVTVKDPTGAVVMTKGWPGLAEAHDGIREILHKQWAKNHPKQVVEHVYEDGSDADE